MRVGSVAFAMAVVAWGTRVRAQERDSRGDPTTNAFSRYGRAELEVPRTAYRPGDAIWVTFRIRNRGYQTIRIFPAREANTSFQFLLTDRHDREVPMRAAGAGRESAEPTVDIAGDEVKEVILHPGESFTRRIRLDRLYELKPGGEYRVVGYFYPDPRRTFFVRTANTAKLRLDRARDPLRRAVLPEEFFNDSIPEISPEETVYLFLSAEIKKNWPGYLKYLDLRKFILAYDRFASRYAAAPEHTKPQVLREFQRFLTSGPTDRLHYFKIVKKEFDRTEEGETMDEGRVHVTVRAERRTRGYSVLYNYRYTLERDRRRAGFWRIVYVTAGVVR